MAHSSDSTSPMSLPRKDTGRTLSERRPGDDNFLLGGQIQPGSHDADATVAGVPKSKMSMGLIISLVALAIAAIALLKK